MNLPESLDLDTGSQRKPINSWCVSFDTECTCYSAPVQYVRFFSCQKDFLTAPDMHSHVGQCPFMSVATKCLNECTMGFYNDMKCALEMCLVYNRDFFFFDKKSISCLFEKKLFWIIIC